MAGIFLFQDETLTKLEPQLFQSEHEFQGLLANHPGLLSGNQSGADGSGRLLLVRREMGIPGEEFGAERWSVDHVFLDQDGLPILVEVKRSSDTRIRRELVGQMLDYAANAVAYWPAEDIRAGFETRCAAQDLDPEDELAAFLSDGDEPDAFWERVTTNLQAKRLRLLFVADAIPPELRRIVEFLNEQMSPAEVLALELKQYVNGATRTFVPHLFGQTTEAERKKTVRRTSAAWDEASFFEHVDHECSPQVTAATRRLYEWAHSNHSYCWGKGQIVPSFYIGHRKPSASILSLRAGAVSVLFANLKETPPFDQTEVQRVFIRKLNHIAGIDINEDSFGRTYRDIRLHSLHLPEGVEQLLEVFCWMGEQSEVANSARPLT